MNRDKVITGGSAYTDIDVLACAIAYKKLLKNAMAVLRAPFNETIPDSIKNWDLQIDLEFPEGCQYILVDVSDPNFFESFVELDQVVEVIDHHFGFEAYWKQRLGEKSVVEHVGSCATLIWEKYNHSPIDTLSANLLYTAIFANTLNLQAEVTTERDIAAFNELKNHTDLPSNWIAQYYSEVSQSILQDPQKAVKKDTKRLQISGKEITIAQLEVWSAKELLHEELSKSQSLLIVSDISTQKSHFLSTDQAIQQWITKSTNAEFKGHVATADRLWMRKEVIREFTSSAACRTS